LIIPWDCEAGGFGGSGLVLQHIGPYGYRAGYLHKSPTLERTTLVEIGKLKQLRVLYHGGKIILVFITDSVLSVGVDTEDLERVRKMSHT
jgi:3-deoxy-manno-octulosonate cytidylyltransferase (CMP-KDO synthetase)